MNIKRLLPLLLVILFVLPLNLFAQEVKVTSKVTDKKTGLPIEGASVKIKNSTTTVTTNSDGDFSITAPSSESIISITNVGYRIFESKVGDGKLTIQLEISNTDMDEVVVVGYGTQKRSHLTGSVETIKASEVQDLPTGNLGAALSGRVLGLSVSGGISRPGSAPSLRLRNPESVSKDGGTTTPLIVIDGMIQVTSQGQNDATLFNSLDPTEVENISFLKDGAAAIYGARAANGAIIVTTKRGQNGKPRITYSGSYAVNDEAYRPKMMSAYELANYINIVNGPNGANITNLEDRTRFFSQDELEHFKTVNYDWLDMAWKSASNMRHTVSLSGGAERATYFASASYFTQDGNLGKLDFGRWNFRAGTDVQVASGLKAGLQVAGTLTNSMSVNSKIGGEQIENDYRMMLRAPRYVPTYIDGRPVKMPGGTGQNDLSAYHFFELNNFNNYTDQNENTSTVNLYLEYEPTFLKGLKARGSYVRNSGSSRDARLGTRYMLYRFNLLGDNQHIFDGATVRDSAFYSNENRVRLNNNRSSSYQANFTLSYAKKIGLHDVSALFSVERSETESSQEEVMRENPSQSSNGQLNSAFGAIDGRTFFYENGTLGYIGRVNYGYDNKYFAEFLFRSDANTKFSPENYWGKFYSLSAGWVISNENFFKSNFINFLKLRYSYGLLGNDDTRIWQWRQRYTYQNGQGGVFGPGNPAASTGIKMEASPNPDARWTTDIKQNLGIDAKMFNNRLSTTVEGFYNKAREVFINRTSNVPVTVGGTVAAQNYGQSDYFGVELGLGWDDKIGRDFTFGVSARLSWYENKVIRGDYNPIDVQYPWNGREGVSGDIGKWGYDYLGMFRDQAEIDAYVTKYGITNVFGTPINQLRPGMLYYRDVRGPLQADGSFASPDGIIDNNDQIKLARKASNHWGLGSTIRLGYKGLSFECVITGSWGGWAEIDGRNVLQTNIDNLYQNGVAYWNDIYDPQANPTGKYPNPFHNAINLTPLSSFWEVSSFRLRMRNANLSYSIPKSLTNKLKISSARIVLTALNPINFYNPYTYRDADASWDAYPILRTFSCGVNLTL